MNTPKIETFIRQNNHSFKLLSIKEGPNFKAFRIDGEFELIENQIKFNPSNDPLLITSKTRQRSLDSFHLQLMKQINKSYKVALA